MRESWETSILFITTASGAITAPESNTILQPGGFLTAKLQAVDPCLTGAYTICHFTWEFSMMFLNSKKLIPSCLSPGWMHLIRETIPTM